MKYRISASNERVWCTTQLAKLNFNHLIGRTHSWHFFFQLFIRYLQGLVSVFAQKHLLPSFLERVLFTVIFFNCSSVHGFFQVVFCPCFFYRFCRRANIRPRASHGRALAAVPLHMSPPAPWEVSRFCSVSSARNPTPASAKKVVSHLIKGLVLV